MKKRVLSVLLVIALLVAVGIVAAQANETAPTADEIIAGAKTMTFPQDGSDFTAKCPACNEEVTWKGMTQENWEANGRNYNGHYYLAGDLTDVSTDETVVISANGKLCLHLNGHSVSGAESGKWSAAIRGNANGVNIMGNGTVNGNASAALWANGPMNVYGGTYNTDVTIGVEVRGATGEAFNLYAGTITSGNIRLIGAGAQVNLYGGEYAGSGSICYGDNREDMYVRVFDGAKITAPNGINAQCLNVVVTGGEISKIATTIYTKSLSISGNPVIGSLNTAFKATYGQFTEGAKIGFGTYTGVISTAYETKPEAEAVAATFPVAPGKVITVNDDKTLSYGNRTTPYTPEEIIANSNAMTFTGAEAGDAGYCYHCKKDVTWKPLTTANQDANGLINITGGENHYYLQSETITAGSNGTGTLNIAGGTTCLHLNGKTISNTTLAAIRNWGAQLNLMGEGNVIGGNSGWGALTVAGDNTARVTNIYGGTLQGTSAGNLALRINCTTKIYDCTVQTGKTLIAIEQYHRHDTTVVINGGDFTNSAFEINVEMTCTNEAPAYAAFYGKTFYNYVTVNGGNFGTITNNGYLTVNGGTIASLVGTENAKQEINVAGKPVINSVDLSASPVKLTVGALTQGASITTAAIGDLTEAFATPEAAEAAKAYFSAASGYKLIISDSKLVCTLAANKDIPAEVIDYANNEMPKIAGFAGETAFNSFCPHCGLTVTWTPISEDNTQGLAYSSGAVHYFLAGSKTITRGFYNDGADSVLYLNGKTMTGTFNCGKNKSLTILGNGNVTGSADAALIGSGTYKIYGGTYARNATGNNIASVNANGPFYFYGGTITAAEDGSVFMHSGQYYINGGTVEGRFYIDNNGTNPSLTLNGGTMSGGIGMGYGTVTLNGGTFTNTEIGVGGSEAKLTYLNLGGVTFTEDVEINNHGGVGIVTFGADFDQTVTVNIAKLNEENGSYGRTETLYKATTAGLHEDAVIFAADVDNNRYGLVYDSVANNGNLVIAKTSIVNGENVSWYQDLQAAVDAFNGTGYIKLYTDEETAVLGKTIAIDLNGKKEIAVSGTGRIVGMDTFTQDGFGRQPGYVLIDEGANITVAAMETTPAGDGTVTGFLPVTDGNGETTFTYFTMKLSGVALKANQNTVGMYFKGTWNFNNNLRQDAGVEAGVVVNVAANPEAGFRTPAQDGKNYNGYYAMNAADVINDQPVTSVLVNDIMKAEGREPATNSQYGQKQINAAAFVTVNGVDILTEVKSLSVMDILKMFEKDENAAQFEVMKTKLNNFYTIWVDKANLEAWGLTKIGK